MTQPYDERPDAPVSTDETPTEETHAAEQPVQEAPVEVAPVQVAPAPDDEGGFGDPRVDDAVARLQELTERPVGEHAEVYDDVHPRLRDALEEAAVEPADEPRG